MSAANILATLPRATESVGDGQPCVYQAITVLTDKRSRAQNDPVQLRRSQSIIGLPFHFHIVLKAIFSRLSATRIHKGGDQINTRYTIRPGRMNGFYDALPIDCCSALKSTTSGAGREYDNIAIPREFVKVFYGHGR